jgi:hypothetical protein
VLQQPPGGEDEGVLVVGFLGNGHVLQREEAPAPGWERLGKEEGRAGVRRIGHRVLQPDLFDAVVGDAGEHRRHARHLAVDLLWAGVAPAGAEVGRPSRASMRRARSQIISESGRAWPRGAMARRTRCTRRSVLVKVPSFSAHDTAGRKTSAKAPDSLMKMSCATRNSRCFMCWRVTLRFGSVIIGFSPMM